MWPDALIDATCLRRKSQTISGNRNGATKAPLAPSTWIMMFQPFFSFTSPAAASTHAHGHLLLVLSTLHWTPLTEVQQRLSSEIWAVQRIWEPNERRVQRMLLTLHSIQLVGL